VRPGPTAEALWPFSLELYGRPGVEPLLLELQDAHGQCVPFLLWSLWIAATGRPIDPAQAASCADLARAWQDAAVAPLRRLRRTLKASAKAETIQARIRIGVKALELEAERMLLQMLEEASPASAAVPSDSLHALRVAARAWGAKAPGALLEKLATLAA
jgi:uncharacterized protein (TIGR02444 family)